MKAFLIDPTTQTISEVEYDGNFKSIYPLIGADTFTLVTFNHHQDGVFVDDEGLINGNQDGWFYHTGYPYQPLKGKGLVLGCNEIGESVEPVVSLEELRTQVKFLSDEEARKLAIDRSVTVRAL